MAEEIKELEEKNLNLLLKVESLTTHVNRLELNEGEVRDVRFMNLNQSLVTENNGVQIFELNDSLKTLYIG